MITEEQKKAALEWIDANLEHGRRCYKNSQMYCNFEPDVEKARKTVAILETIRAAIAPSEPMGWQKLDDANWPGSEEAVIVAGKAVEPHTGMYVCVARSWEGVFETEQGRLRNQPTHWMPMPPPPTGAT